MKRGSQHIMTIHIYQRRSAVLLLMIDYMNFRLALAISFKGNFHMRREKTYTN